MALRTAVQVTGDDLTFEDVWTVAVERAPAQLDEAARGKIARARRNRRAAPGLPEPRRPPARAEPRLRRREWRSRAARPPGAAARGRGRGLVRRSEAARSRGARCGRADTARAPREGGALARQRHAVHGGARRTRAGARREARNSRGHRLRALARGAAGVTVELPAADPRGPA